MVEHTTFGTQQSHQIPSPFLNGRERSSFPGLVPPDIMVNSKLGGAVKPGNSKVVIGYQVDEFTHMVSRMLYCSITNLLLIGGEGVNFSQVPT